MNAHTIISSSPERTRRIAARLAAGLSTPCRIALTGPLGAGKTHFVQGLAEGLGIRAPIRSPSYTLINAYEGPPRLYHCDWYRLETDEDVESTGVEDLLAEDAVVVVEWAEKHPGWLDDPRLEILFETLDADRRRLTFTDPTPGHFTPAIQQAIKTA